MGAKNFVGGGALTSEMVTLLLSVTLAVAVGAITVLLVKLKAHRRRCGELSDRIRQWEDLWQRQEALFKEQSQH